VRRPGLGPVAGAPVANAPEQPVGRRSGLPVHGPLPVAPVGHCGLRGRDRQRATPAASGFGKTIRRQGETCSESERLNSKRF